MANYGHNPTHLDGERAGPLPKDTRGYALQSLKPLHRAMARLVLCGIKQKELSLRFGITLSQIRSITNSPLFKAELARLELTAEETTLDIKKELTGLTGRSLEVIAEDLFAGERSSHRTAVAFNILDRTGYAKSDKPLIDASKKLTIIQAAPMPGEDPEEWKERLAKLKEELGEQGEDEIPQDLLE